MSATPEMPDRARLEKILEVVDPRHMIPAPDDLEILFAAARCALAAAPIETQFIGANGDTITATVSSGNLFDAEALMASTEMLNFALASFNANAAAARSLARPGGAKEESDLATAREMLKQKLAAWLAAARYQHDWRQPDLLGLSDLEAGRLFKSFVAGVEDWGRKQWADKAKLTVGLAFLAQAQLVKMAHGSNAGTLKLTLEDVALESGPAGTWTLVLRKKK